MSRPNRENSGKPSSRAVEFLTERAKVLQDGWEEAMISVKKARRAVQQWRENMGAVATIMPGYWKEWQKRVWHLS
jgi:hypothetical protein